MVYMKYKLIRIILLHHRRSRGVKGAMPPKKNF